MRKRNIQIITRLDKDEHGRFQKRVKKSGLRVRAHYYGKQPFADAYADVFASLLESSCEKAKSSIRTFDRGKPFPYDLDRNHKGCDRNGTTD